MLLPFPSPWHTLDCPRHTNAPGRVVENNGYKILAFYLEFHHSDGSLTCENTFSVVVPNMWNSLLQEIQQAPNVLLQS